jgi:hypothetical protein
LLGYDLLGKPVPTFPDHTRSAAIGAAAAACYPHARIEETYAVDVQEVRKIDAYLKKLFGNARIRVVPRPKKEDSAEVYIGEEFVGVLFVDDEDDERSYNFQMAILATDLE